MNATPTNMRTYSSASLAQARPWGRLMEIDRAREEAAWTLGASRWRTFGKVIPPMITPAIISGAPLSFARALGEFGSIVVAARSTSRRAPAAPNFVGRSLNTCATTRSMRAASSSTPIPTALKRNCASVSSEAIWAGLSIRRALVKTANFSARAKTCSSFSTMKRCAFRKPGGNRQPCRA
ncbi:MAG: ABC transporter permease subunit [Blastocatellia bacterium]